MKVSNKYLELFLHIPSDQVLHWNDIPISTLISELKTRLELHTGIIAELQKLSINDTMLEHGKTLEELKVKSGSFIRVKLKENSLEQIYINALNGNTNDVFRLGVQFMETDKSTNEESDGVDVVDMDPVVGWNRIVPYRAFQASFAASFGGHVELLTRLVKESAVSVHMRSQSGRTLLHACASQGHLFCVDFLLARGINAKYVDKQGMTALMAAAEHNHVRVEKRIWLFTWNSDVLEEIERTKTEEEGGEECKRKVKEENEAEITGQIENKPIRDAYIKLPAINEQSMMISSKTKKIQQAKDTNLPNVPTVVQDDSSQTKPLKRKKTSCTELNIMSIAKSHEKEELILTKPIVQTDEKNIRVSAWVQSTTAKCPAPMLSPRLVVTDVTDPIPNISHSWEDTKSQRTNESLLYRMADSGKTNDFVPRTNIRRKGPQKISTAIEEPIQIVEQRTSTPVCNDVDIVAIHPIKEVIKTDPQLIQNQNRRENKKKTLTDRKRNTEGHFMEAIQQIPDETLSFSRRLSMFPSSLSMIEGNNDVEEYSNTLNIDHTCQNIDLTTLQEIPNNESLEFSLTKAFIPKEENNIDNNTIQKKDMEIWVPEESFYCSSSDFSRLYYRRRFTKSYDEWLEEKKKIRRETLKKLNESIAVPSMDGANVIADTENAQKTQRAFEEWLQLKTKERMKSKNLARMRQKLENENTVQRSMTFEEWKKLKRNASLKETESICKRKVPRREGHGITFEQWKNLKNEQKKFMDTTAEDSNKRSARGGIPFESWLKMKEEKNKEESAIHNAMKAQEKKMKDFLQHFRFNDPSQRTFEEWYLEKKYQQRYQYLQSMKGKGKEKKMRYPEDSSLIFNMWLLNKHVSEMECEKEKLKSPSKDRRGRHDIAIDDSSEPSQSSEESDSDDDDFETNQGKGNVENVSTAIDKTIISSDAFKKGSKDNENIDSGLVTKVEEKDSNVIVESSKSFEPFVESDNARDTYESSNTNGKEKEDSVAVDKTSDSSDSSEESDADENTLKSSGVKGDEDDSVAVDKTSDSSDSSKESDADENTLKSSGVKGDEDDSVAVDQNSDSSDSSEESDADENTLKPSAVKEQEEDSVAFDKTSDSSDSSEGSDADEDTLKSSPVKEHEEDSFTVDKNNDSSDSSEESDADEDTLKSSPVKEHEEDSFTVDKNNDSSDSSEESEAGTLKTSAVKEQEDDSVAVDKTSDSSDSSDKSDTDENTLKQSAVKEEKEDSVAVDQNSDSSDSSEESDVDENTLKSSGVKGDEDDSVAVDETSDSSDSSEESDADENTLKSSGVKEQEEDSVAIDQNSDSSDLSEEIDADENTLKPSALKEQDSVAVDKTSDSSDSSEESDADENTLKSSGVKGDEDDLVAVDKTSDPSDSSEESDADENTLKSSGVKGYEDDSVAVDQNSDSSDSSEESNADENTLKPSALKEQEQDSVAVDKTSDSSDSSEESDADENTLKSNAVKEEKEDSFAVDQNSDSSESLEGSDTIEIR